MYNGCCYIVQRLNFERFGYESRELYIGPVPYPHVAHVHGNGELVKFGDYYVDHFSTFVVSSLLYLYSFVEYFPPYK